MLPIVDSSRLVRLPGGGAAPRRLPTLVLYPAPRDGATRSGPFPLVVFGHGFALLPETYSRLLHAWAREGYVVAAPSFPLESKDAPGGPDESDLPNQPRDLTFVISQLLARSAAAGNPLSKLIDPNEIAVAGHSDGGDTALAVAYGGAGRDPRVKAAVILSGAEMPGAAIQHARPNSPPLLAVQGTADTINPPGATAAFFAAAQSPKYLLSLLGAQHIAPYSEEQPQLRIVERVSLAFLGRYLKRDLGSGRRLASLGSVPSVAQLASAP
jgi:dienelactone hydrolase